MDTPVQRVNVLLSCFLVAFHYGMLVAYVAFLKAVILRNYSAVVIITATSLHSSTWIPASCTWLPNCPEFKVLQYNHFCLTEHWEQLQQCLFETLSENNDFVAVCVVEMSPLMIHEHGALYSKQHVLLPLEESTLQELERGKKGVFIGWLCVCISSLVYI